MGDVFALITVAVVVGFVCACACVSWWLDGVVELVRRKLEELSEL